MIELVHRPARSIPPCEPPSPRTIAGPPPEPDRAAGGAISLQTFVPVLGSVTSVLMMVMYRGSNPAFLAIGALVFLISIVSGVGIAFSASARANRQRRAARLRYLDYLEDLRENLREQSAEDRSAALACDPAPDQLAGIASDPRRLWERRPDDPDFLRVRVGTGAVLWNTLNLPTHDDPEQRPDPMMTAEADRVAAAWRTVPGMPVSVPVDSAGDTVIVGTPQASTLVARALVARLACTISPEDLYLALAVPPVRAGLWRGFDLLPHAQAGFDDNHLPSRRTAASISQLGEILRDELSARMRRVAAARHSPLGERSSTSPRLVVIVDSGGQTTQPLPLPEDGYTLQELGVTVIYLVNDQIDEPPSPAWRLTLDPYNPDVQPNVTSDVHDEAGLTGKLAVRTGASWLVENEGLHTALDHIALEKFVALARQLAPLRERPPNVDTLAVETASVMHTLGIEDPTTVDPADLWGRARSRDGFLRVPIGTDDHGAPLLLDLKENAQGGYGPHGICVGATGSGKSELLRTLVLALALTHSPDELSMILVDYKGGSAFAPFAPLGHVAGLIDNLADDPQLTRRARESIAGEVRRRQEMLKQADSSPSITHYTELRKTRPDLPPMPHLLLIIDEFGELLTAEPEFTDLLITIGRIGRSIGIHLLLSSQRIEGGMLRGLDTYLSYWIGLRTFSDQESRTILGTTDAYTLPALPGYGYLKVDTTIYTRFRAGFVSGPVKAPVEQDSSQQQQLVREIPFYPAPKVSAASAHRDTPDEPQIGRTLADETVARLATDPRATKPVWLPPLPTHLTLGDVLGERSPSASLTADIGLIDDPSNQRQDPWTIDLTIGGGHIVCLGAPSSGRTTWLRTLAVSLALTHTPAQVGIYGIDLAGTGLLRLAGFPHVGGVADKGRPETLTRTIEQLDREITAREQAIQTHHLDSLQALRNAHASGNIPELACADVVVLVDGFETLRESFPDLETSLLTMITKGSAVGVHFAIALTRWNQIRPAAQSLIGQRVELRLNDPSESAIKTAASKTIVKAGPGRALTQDLLYAQTALPILTDVPDESVGDEIERLAQYATDSWNGPTATPIRLLPTDLPPNQLPAALPGRVTVGLAQDSFTPVVFDPKVDLHLLAFGDQESGKTNLLHLFIKTLAAQSDPDHLVVAAMDPRDTIATLIDDDYLGGRATNPAQAEQLAAAIARELARRSATPANTDTHQRPHIVVAVDDYHILTAGGGTPLAPLLSYLPQSRDVGLTLILARPVAGLGRALFEPTISALRDAGATICLMSGERSEGKIAGNIYAEHLPPGRAKWIQRGKSARIIQTIHTVPSDSLTIDHLPTGQKPFVDSSSARV